MAFSSLISEKVLASSTNYNQGRYGYKVCKITPHHMAGKLSGRRCAEIFQNPKRNASSNYCIGYDGEIVGCVDENNRAWTSSNKVNDCQAITIEVSNSENGGNWRISDASWNSLVKLCVDICKRYNFRLTYDGTPKGSLTRHNMFANTNCPGPYLQGRFNELVNVVNAQLDNKPAPTPTPTPTPAPSNNFLPARGWFQLGDKSENVGKIASFMRRTFPAYTSAKALGNYYGPNIKSAITEFQKRTGLKADGCVGPITLAKLKAYGFNY